ncbi:MAG: uroporphyrinogen decarboxylase [Alphaproteobacteria bacterium]|nr:MAG: uroporphyrinogen decarboxylase [Alphaproteobacteria bacterium]
MQETPVLLQALQGKVTNRVPFWLMRQAGRYLPEYRALRQQAGSFLNLCFTPELAAEVTLQPLRRFDMDAAIIFSDILVVPLALGQKLDFVEGEGPRLGPLDTGSLRYDSSRITPVYDALSLVRRQLPPDKALIGFAGAPWTVACYMIQGYGDGAFESVVAAAKNNPAEFGMLVGMLTEATIEHLSAQIRAGADAVQIFDSWAGILPETEFSTWVIAPTRRIVAELNKRHPATPIIGFPRQAGYLYARYAAETGVQGLGADPSVDLSQLAAGVSPGICLQGNLDPGLLLKGGEELTAAAENILEAMRHRPFIFNLGHGVIKETPPEHVAALSAVIRSFRQ